MVRTMLPVSCRLWGQSRRMLRTTRQSPKLAENTACTNLGTQKLTTEENATSCGPSTQNRHSTKEVAAPVAKRRIGCGGRYINIAVKPVGTWFARRKRMRNLAQTTGTLRQD